MSIEYWQNRLRELVQKRIKETRDKVAELHISYSVDSEACYGILLEVAAEELDRLEWENCDD